MFCESGDNPISQTNYKKLEDTYIKFKENYMGLTLEIDRTNR